jgi:hypothetical protein
VCPRDGRDARPSARVFVPVFGRFPINKPATFFFSINENGMSCLASKNFLFTLLFCFIYFSLQFSCYFIFLLPCISNLNVRAFKFKGFLMQFAGFKHIVTFPTLNVLVQSHESTKDLVDCLIFTL